MRSLCFCGVLGAPSTKQPVVDRISSRGPAAEAASLSVPKPERLPGKPVAPKLEPIGLQSLCKLPIGTGLRLRTCISHTHTHESTCKRSPEHSYPKSIGTRASHKLTATERADLPSPPKVLSFWVCPVVESDPSSGILDTPLSSTAQTEAVLNKYALCYISFYTHRF